MSNEQRMLFDAGRFSVIEETVVRADGGEASCVYVKHPGAVAILPLVDDRHVCLIRSRRLTVGKTLVEVPAGTREPNEMPLDTARRELAEETGYRAGHLEQLAVYFSSPGILTEQVWVYVASDLTPGPPSREANEEIENFVITFDEALAMIGRGEIQDGKTLVALLMYERERRLGLL